MNFKEWLWTGLADEARAAAERTDYLDVQVRVLLDAARYKLLARRESTPDSARGRHGPEPGWR
jgi:hypothetical protein